jgi:hypothetical protein
MGNLLKIKTPVHAILIWFFGASIITILIMLLSGLSTSGGKQIPMIVFSYSIYVIPSGVFLICILSPFVYRDWFRKYWFIIVIIAVIFSLPFYIAFR